MKLEATEAQEQKALVDWMMLHPKLCNYIIKIDNEGKRSPRQGAETKRMGMHPGACDLFIAVPAGAFHGLWIEMKRNKVYTMAEKNHRTWMRQIKFQAAMRRNGYEAVVAYGWEHGKRLIENYLFDKKSTNDEEE